MLKLTLLPDEYLTVGNNIVVQLLRVSGGRADVAIEAPRAVPVVRGGGAGAAGRETARVPGAAAEEEGAVLPRPGVPVERRPGEGRAEHEAGFRTVGTEWSR